MRRVAILALLLALCLTTFAAAPVSANQVFYGGVKVTFNGHPVTSDVQPQIMNGRTMLPFRAIFETLGATVGYDSSTQTVTGTRGSTTVQMQIGNTTATVNGSPLSMDVAPVIVSSRTLVPVRFVAQSLPGVNVTWDPDTQTAGIVDPNWPHRGGAVSMALWSAPSNIFNPQFGNSAYDVWISSMMFDSPYYLDQGLNPRPALASSWEITDDGMTYILHLRKDATWHDGVPVTAYDYKYTVEGITGKDYLGINNVGFDDVVGYDDWHAGKASELTGIKVIDNYTVSVTLRQVNAAYFLTNLAITPLPAHLYQGKVNVADWGTSNDPYATNPVGNGAFRWGSAAFGQYYILEKNANYYLGAPYIDRVIWKILPQDESIAYLNTGEVDVAEISDFNSLDTLAGYGNVKLNEYPNVTWQNMWMNNRSSSVFGDVEVRKAAAYAIDRMSIINGLLKGHGTMMYTAMSPLYWAYNDDVAHYDFDPAKAKATLDADGWVVGSDGVRVKDGKRLHIVEYYPSGNKIRMAYAPLISKWLTDVGFEVDLRKTDFATLLNVFQTSPFPFDIALIGNIASNAEPDPTSQWACDQIGDNKGNSVAWCNAAADKLLKDALHTNDLDQRKAIYAQWQQIWANEMPSLMLYNSNEVYANNTRLHNFKPGPLTTGHIWNVWEWWVDG